MRDVSEKICREYQNTHFVFNNFFPENSAGFNLLKPNDIYIYIYTYTYTVYSIYIYIYIYMSYRSANLQTLHFKYLFNKYTY